MKVKKIHQCPNCYTEPSYMQEVMPDRYNKGYYECPKCGLRAPFVTPHDQNNAGLNWNSLCFNFLFGEDSFGSDDWHEEYYEDDDN